MSTRKQPKIKTILALATAMAILALTAISAHAASMAASLMAPTVDDEDIANYGTLTGTDKWWADTAVSGRPKGQSFTTSGTAVLLKAFTYQTSTKAEPTKTYVIRVGTITRTDPGDPATWVFTEITSETAVQTFTWNASEYMTWTFDTPVLLLPNTEYGVDVGMRSSTSAWQTGIPYIYRTADEYPGGTRYMSGTAGLGIGDSTMNNVEGDMIFHADLEDPMGPSPGNGATVPAGNVELSWTNLPPNVGTDVYVDVWFGTDPGSLTQVVTAGLNTTAVTVSAPVADTYYWRVDSHLDGSPTGTPIEGTLFVFHVIDTDGDGMPDWFELAHTNPPSPTALNPGDDLEPDGLTNLEEYQLGTDPNNPDTDGDTLQDGDEVAGAGSRPPTDPTNSDTDDDGLNDGVESNTGVFVNASDTGTDPTLVDTDADGLRDGVETATGIFVDETNTGTQPTMADTDGDGAGDWYEIVATYTDPIDPGDHPGIPYPLPDPDATTPTTTKPVKVYILLGQSNMVGMGNVNNGVVVQPGTLQTITKLENKFPNLVDDAGEWTVRNDVWYKGVVTATANKWLTIGCGSNSGAIGPEMGFGHVMGYYHDEPVLVIKSSQGNRSLGWDFLPPGSPQYIVDEWTYAGYGDSPHRWLTGTTPVPIAWYAGKQYDDCVAAVHDVLDNFASNFPDWAAQGYEIAGFVWWQGHRDQFDSSHADRYELNLVNFINALRAEFHVPNAPFVLATIAFDGGPYAPDSAYGKIHAAQMAVGDPAKHPEFAGNVLSTNALGYWRTVEESPVAQNHHYNRNAETFMLVGDALGRGMLQLLGTPQAAVPYNWPLYE